MRFICGFLLGTFFFTTLVLAEGVQEVTLSTLLNHARLSNQELAATQMNEEIFALENGRVKSEFAPRMKARAGVGPATRVSGDALSSTSDGELGAAFLAGIEFSYPLWTWGRKENYLNAVELGQRVKKSESEEKWADLSFRIKEAYFGAVLAHSLVDFVEGGLEQVRSALEGVKSDKQKADKSRLEILLAQGEAKKVEVMNLQRLAQMGLRVQSNFEGAVSFDEKWMVLQERELKDLEYYQKIAQQVHPKIKMLEAGVQAKDALKHAEKKANYPVLASLAKYDYSHTDVRENQRSVFAYDPLSTSQGIVGLGFEWSWQAGQLDYKLQKLHVENLQLKTQRAYADKGLGALVEKAWWDVKKCEEQQKSLHIAQLEAKKWLSRELISWGSGLGDSKRLADAFGVRALTRKEYLESLYQYEMAWASLSKSVGQEVDPTLEQHIKY